MVADKAAEWLEMAEEKAALYASFLCLTLLLQLLVSISIGNVLFLSSISSAFSACLEIISVHTFYTFPGS
jgi:hypothetical protein